VPAVLEKTVEYTPHGQRVLADGVSHSPTLGLLPKERRHYGLPVVGPIFVEMGRGVARVQQLLLRYNLGHSVRELRVGKLLTQEELARAAGISLRQLVRIESNEVEPRFSTMRKLAGVLGVEPAELLDPE
jgi:DNA-binding XRE family transcriptional regulator